MGGLTCEIKPAEGQFISTAICPGPKNYWYILDSGVQHGCVKGITMHENASKIINYEAMHDLIFNNNLKKIEVEQLQFKCNREKFSMNTNIIKKKYGFVYDKRVIQAGFNTLPYGHDDIEENLE